MEMDIGTIIGIIVLIVGFILMAVELVVPGFGLPGIAGIICLLAGVFLTAKTVEEGIFISIIIIVILGILMTVVLGLLSHRKLKSPIILDCEVTGGESFLNSADLNYLLNREGIALTDLRPVGKGEFDGIGLDVYSDGAYIEKGTAVVIHKIMGNRLVVKKIKNKKEKEC